MDHDLDFSLPPRKKRFTFKSYEQSLKEVHVPSSVVTTSFDEEVPDNGSHFYDRLQELQQLNLSPAFVKFAEKAGRLSESLPLLLHNWKDITALWIESLQASLSNRDGGEAVKPLLELLKTLVYDLRSNIRPQYMSLLQALTPLILQKLDPLAFTELFVTFQALFKYVLIPTLPSSLLKLTWNELASPLRDAKDEVRRVLSEVWGSILRRMKIAQRNEAIELMLESLHKHPTLRDGIAWVIVQACQAPSKSLHPCTPSVLSEIIRIHLDDLEASTEIALLLRRILTSFVHHVPGPLQFSPASDILVQGLRTQLDAYEAGLLSSTTSLIRIMTVVQTPCLVRGGFRIPQEALSSILEIMGRMQTPTVQKIPDEYVALLVSTLSGAEPSVWMGKGRTAIERVWENDLVSLRAAGILSDMDWNGWATLVLPHVFTHLPRLLKEQLPVSGEAVRLLASLVDNDRLSTATPAWRAEIEQWASSEIEQWQFTDHNACSLIHITMMIPHILGESMAPHVVNVVDRLLALVAEDRHSDSPFNASIMLSHCLNALHRLNDKSFVPDKLAAWTREILASWPHHPLLMEAITRLCEQSPDISPGSLSYDDLFQRLEGTLLSPDRVSRRTALRMLYLKASASISEGSIAHTDVPTEIIGLCIAAESIPLEVAGARERVLRTRKVGTAAAQHNDATRAFAARWLLAQLQVNLRPLWEPAQESIALLLEDKPDTIWPIVFGELQKSATRSISTQSTRSELEWEQESKPFDFITEQEKSWRCSSAARHHEVLALWNRRPMNTVASRLTQMQQSLDKLDVRNYETEILHALSRAASIVQKRSREFSPFFLSLSPSTLPRTRLKAYLTLVSKFNNPKALHSSSALYELHISLLSKPEHDIQALALDCLLSYKSPALLRHESQLRGVLDETKWRDELALLVATDVQESHRPEFMRALVGLLYGLIGDRKARRQSGPDRRSAALQALSHCTSSELSVFVDLMLSAFPTFHWPSKGPFKLCGLVNTTVAQQAGYLSLLGDSLRILGLKLIDSWPKLLTATLEIVHTAQLAISLGESEKDGGVDVFETLEDVDLPSADLLDSANIRKAQKSLRQTGLKRLADFFRISYTAVDYATYMQAAFPTCISPRLELFAQENTQAPSALLELIAVLASSSPSARFLVAFDSRLLPEVFKCLIGVNVKEPVISKVLDIVDRLLELSANDQYISEHIVKKHAGNLLQHLSTMFEKSVKIGIKADVTTQRLIKILSALSEHMTEPEDAVRLLSLLHPLLKKPGRIVPEKVKCDLLRVMRHAMQLAPECQHTSSPTYLQCFETFAGLFQFLRTQAARLELLAGFRQLTSLDASLSDLMETVALLNAYSSKRMDEPDFDRRLRGFEQLHDSSKYPVFHHQYWQVIVNNMMFCINDPEELALRSSAAQTLRLFLVAVASEIHEHTGGPLVSLLENTLYPALRAGLRSKVEQVRSDILGVLAFAVETLKTHPLLFELTPLLANGDAEANFFNNIHHIQVHRRTRALRRLADFSTENSVRSSTLVDILIPLVENFVEAHGFDHHLVNEAVTTLGKLSNSLAWGAYNSLLQRHLHAAGEKGSNQKTRLRCLIAILDGFHFQVSQPALPETLSVSDDFVGREKIPLYPDRKLEDAIVNRLLPSLITFMEQREDTEDVLRVPVAIGVIKVALHLPETIRLPQLERLIIILSQALRSKSQETRDTVRETLGRIAVLLGPNLLPEILKQLQAALLRGPQLHILAFVTHYLLVLVTSPQHLENFKNIDDSVVSISNIAAEVVFGQSGRDVQSEDFRTTIHEVRGSSTRGLDIFSLVARYVTPSKISSLLAPIRSIMHETEATKVMQQVDDVLRRIASGLNANEHLTPTDTLVLCHTLISQNSKFATQQHLHTKPLKRRKQDVDVQMERPIFVTNDAYENNSFRFVGLGLDLFNTAFRRGRFDFGAPSTIMRLEPMVPTIGNTLYSTTSSILVLGVRAASFIAKSPLQSVPKSLPVFIRRIFAIVKEAGSTESEVVQHAFKALAIIIRDCPGAKIQTEDLTYLLELLIPDIEEKDRQIAVFALLKAIISRKFVVPEIYDVMEKTASIMVTNQSIQVQELCRGALLQFILDYPQGKGRLRTQMTFLAQNLSYVFESGRISVLQFLGATVSKFDAALVQEYADLLSVALFMVLANDESTKCRELAAELLKALCIRLDSSSLSSLFDRLHLWAVQDRSLSLQRTVAHVYGILADLPEAFDRNSVLIDDLNQLLLSSSNNLKAAEANFEDITFSDDTSIEWRLPYHTITTFAKIIKVQPGALTDPSGLNWDVVAEHLLFPHSWVRLGSARLIGSLCSAYPPGLPDPSLSPTHPLSRGGLITLANKLCIQLRSLHLEDPLSVQVVKNLLYVGRCFALWPEFITQVESNENSGDEDASVDMKHADANRRAAANPLRWMFSKLSFQARASHIARRNRQVTSETRWSLEIQSIFRWFAAMTSHLSTEDLENFLTHMLTPVYRVLEDDTIRDPQMDELRSTGQELQTLIQEKVGSTKFASAYNSIRQGVLATRRDRRSAKAIKATTTPEYAAQRKMRRNVTKKASRKRKHEEFSNEKIKLGLKRARFD